MADEAACLYLVAQGHFLNETDEQWQTGLHLAFEYNLATPANVDVCGHTALDFTTVSRTESDWDIVGNWKAHDGIATFNPDDYLNDTVGPAWAAYLPDWGVSHVQLDRLILYPIGADGHVVEEWKMTLSWTSAFPTGGTSSDLLPTSISPLLSFRTERPGKRGRGRQYMPPTGVSAVDSDGRMTADFQTAFLVASQTYIQDVALTGGGLQHFWCLPAVIPQVPANYAVITEINVNNVFADQRRRKRQAVPVRAVASISY